MLKRCIPRSSRAVRWLGHNVVPLQHRTKPRLTMFATQFAPCTTLHSTTPLPAETYRVSLFDVSSPVAITPSHLLTGRFLQLHSVMASTIRRVGLTLQPSWCHFATPSPLSPLLLRTSLLPPLIRQPILGTQKLSGVRTRKMFHTLHQK